MATGGVGEAALVAEALGEAALVDAAATTTSALLAEGALADLGISMLGSEVAGASAIPSAAGMVSQANTASNLSNMLGTLQPGAFANPVDLPAALQYPGVGPASPVGQTALNIFGDAGTMTDAATSGILGSGAPAGMTAEQAAAYFGSPGAFGTPTEFAGIAAPAASGQGMPTGLNQLLQKALGQKTAKFVEDYPYALPAAAGAMYMMNKERRGMTPPSGSYSGPLSQFRFNPASYTPYSPIRTMADGGIAGTERGMFPQSQFDKTQYATPTQMPTSAEVVASDYEPRVNPYTGEMQYAPGGAVGLSKIEDLIDEAESTSDGIASLLSKGRSDNPDALAAIEKMRQRKEAESAHARGIRATRAAAGGTMHSHLGGYSDGGRLLKGPGDGMSDSIPADIGGRQPARLADGEFVVPADVVSHLGNGSTDAGAKKLYDMMDKVRKARTGNKKQGKEIKAHKYLPT